MWNKAGINHGAGRSCCPAPLAASVVLCWAWPDIHLAERPGAEFSPTYHLNFLIIIRERLLSHTPEAQ